MNLLDLALIIVIVVSVAGRVQRLCRLGIEDSQLFRIMDLGIFASSPAILGDERAGHDANAD